MTSNPEGKLANCSDESKWGKKRHQLFLSVQFCYQDSRNWLICFSKFVLHFYIFQSCAQFNQNNWVSIRFTKETTTAQGKFISFPRCHNVSLSLAYTFQLTLRQTLIWRELVKLIRQTESLNLTIWSDERWACSGKQHNLKNFDL